MVNLNIEAYQFKHAFIEDGQSIILIPAILQKMDNESCRLQLPEISYAVGRRRFARFACQDITSELLQSGLIARGELLDFSPAAFRISIHKDASNFIQWFNPDVVATIHLIHRQNIVFSGACRCIRQQKTASHVEFVFAPSVNAISRFKAREIRSPRLQITPPPTVAFEHPLCNKIIQREIFDTSAGGFSVMEKAGEGVLMPGMIIHNLTIMYAGLLEITCNVQIIYAKEEQQQVRSGMAILDMEPADYSRLTQILAQSVDPLLCITGKVDLDALWELFFESGFIYPKKFELLEPYRKDFIKTHQKLYRQDSDVSVCVTYQKSGRIYGHISMLRAYEKTWLVHHYAAQAMDNKHTGLKVLKSLLFYIYDIYRLPSANMDYFMAYFRPETKIMDRFLAGFARSIANPKLCSSDLFSYIPFHAQFPAAQLPERWELNASSDADIWELEQFYNNASGGLLMDVLQLRNKTSTDTSVGKAYQRFDLKRKWVAYTLSYKRNARAVLIADQSDIGANLSELINGIKIMVMDNDELPWDVLSTAVSQLAQAHYLQNVTLLVYPSAYMEDKNIPVGKRYCLWAMDIQCGEEFLKYMDTHFRFGLKQ
jgi:hypothetical protein